MEEINEFKQTTDKNEKVTYTFNDKGILVSEMHGEIDIDTIARFFLDEGLF